MGGNYLFNEVPYVLKPRMVTFNLLQSTDESLSRDTMSMAANLGSFLANLQSLMDPPKLLPEGQRYPESCNNSAGLMFNNQGSRLPSVKYHTL
jgi:hypothetical protein